MWIISCNSGDKIKKTEMGRACNTYGREERYIQGLVGKIEGRRAFRRPRCRWEDNIKMSFRQLGWRACTEPVLLRIGTGGGLLWMRWWTFGFHKMREISWLAEDLLAPHIGLCCVELVSYMNYSTACNKSIHLIFTDNSSRLWLTF